MLTGELILRERKEYKMKMHVVKQRLMVLTAAVLMSVGLFSVQASAAKKDAKFQKKANKIAEENGTQAVRTIWWKAKLTANVKTTDVATGKKIKLKKGKKVTIIQRDYHEKAGISQCRIKGGKECYIANAYLNIYAPITTGAKGDYTEADKLAYINNQTIKSSTDTMVWISLDKQRVNIFKGSNRNWELVRTMKTSTGKADAPTLDVSFLKKYVIQWKKPDVKGLLFYSAIYGSGMHKWPGSGYSKYSGKTPVSHSCVRLGTDDAKWVYDNDNVPINSRVWIW